MSTYAIIRTGGKQYRVAAEDVLRGARVDAEPGSVVAFGEVLVVGEFLPFGRGEIDDQQLRRVGMNGVGRHAKIEEADERHFRCNDAHDRRAGLLRHALQIAAAAIRDESGEFARRKPVEIGYPYMRAMGASLRRAGVWFEDLTGLFAGASVSVVILIALLVCLIPTTIGALLSAIGIAGMDRLVRRNVLALSGRAVEASGDVDVLLLDKTGTITIGNRLASEFIPMPGVSEAELAEVAQMASLADETPEGRSIVALAKQHGIREHDMANLKPEFVPFTAQTRMSGVNFDGQRLRKGAGDAVIKFVTEAGGTSPAELQPALDQIGREGGTPLAVARNSQVMGVIYLKDTIKQGMRERFDHLRAMGIRTIMITGDNRLTAAKIAEESGVDDFLAEATPEAKLELIKEQQATGRLVAMTGDGTNDAPALAQADVGVAMNTGTQAAREAGNMVDLDSNPTKLIEIVEVGKQLLITRGALTTFSIANDVAKYFAILPAIFATTWAATPGGQSPLHVLNIMNLGTPQSAVISAIIFNAIVIPLLIPISLRGVRYRPIGASALLRRNLLIYGLGGLIAPFIGIKLIDLIVHNLLGS